MLKTGEMLIMLIMLIPEKLWEGPPPDLREKEREEREKAT